MPTNNQLPTNCYQVMQTWLHKLLSQPYAICSFLQHFMTRSTLYLEALSLYICIIYWLRVKISWYYCQGHLLNVGTTLNVVDCFLPCFLGRAVLYYSIVQHSSSPEGHNHLVNIFVRKIKRTGCFYKLEQACKPCGLSCWVWGICFKSCVIC